MNKIITIILLLTPFCGLAQVDWENPKGAIKNEEIVIEKDKQIVLSSVSRRFSAITIDPLPIDTNAIKFIPKEFIIDLPKIPVKLRPRTMKTEPLNKTYWGNFKAGYGSYVSPYFQADVATKRSDEYAMALHFRHFSSKNGPIDKSNSGLSNTDAYLSGKLFLNKATLGGSIGGKFDTYHLYGYGASPVPEAGNIRQRLSNFEIGLNLTDNNEKDNFYYLLSGGVDLFNAKDLAWKETDISTKLNANISVSNELNVNLAGSFHAGIQDKVGLTSNRLYYMLKPIGSYTYNDAFEFELGAGLYGTKDAINSFKHKIYITPHIVARYNFKSGHTISGGVKGEVNWNSARNQFNKNPYLGESTIINNEVKPVDVFVEANGKIIPKVDFLLGYHASVYKVFGQFINNDLDQSTFEIDYNTNTNLVHDIGLKFDFLTGKNISFSVFGNYFIYDFENIDNVYHLPKMNVGFKAGFVLMDKLSTELALTYIDGIYAQDLNATNINVKLNSILDLNLSANYKINSNLALFVKMQNIAGNQYQYYYKYPTKGFQFLGGVSFTL